MIAAGAAALLYGSARDRLAQVRAIGSSTARTMHLTTSCGRPGAVWRVPSHSTKSSCRWPSRCRSTLALDAAEVWTGSDGPSSAPSRRPTSSGRLPITANEELVVGAGRRVGSRLGQGLAAGVVVRAPRRGARRWRPSRTPVSSWASSSWSDHRVASPFREGDERVLTELARLGLGHCTTSTLTPRSRPHWTSFGAKRRSCSSPRPRAAADAERRRIERNLHDGAQQHLVALAVQLGARGSGCRARPGPDPADAGAAQPRPPRSHSRAPRGSPTASIRLSSGTAAYPRPLLAAAHPIGRADDVADGWDRSLPGGGRGRGVLLLPRSPPKRGQVRDRAVHAIIRVWEERGRAACSR